MIDVFVAEQAIVKQLNEEEGSQTSCVISDLPDGIKTHFTQVCTPNQKGQARYRCLTCSHEFECSGRNRLIHHVAGISPNGSPTRHVKACPNPHPPLRDALIEKIRREQPEKLLQQSLLRKRKAEKERQALLEKQALEYMTTLTSGESSPLQGSDSSSDSQDDLSVEKKRKTVPADEFASPSLMQTLESYPKERLLRIFHFLDIIASQPLQFAVFLDSTSKYVNLKNST